LSHIVPHALTRSFDVRHRAELLADNDSVLEMRSRWGRSIATFLARIEGRSLGIVVNDSRFLGCAIDSTSADKMACFLQLSDTHGLCLSGFASWSTTIALRAQR
jgi:acetyl-CoA carboxylase carboxyltransferase component